MRRRFLPLALILAAAAPTTSRGEDLTMTTSYPSPAGIYKSLTTTGPGNTILTRDGGRVGIGTLNPAAQLDVAGAGNLKVGNLPVAAGAVTDNGAILTVGPLNAINFARRNLASYPAAGAQAAGDHYGWYSPDGSARLWTPVRGDLITVTPGGAVGIGTVGPMAALDVRGDIRFNNNFGWGTGNGLIYAGSPGNFGGREAVFTVHDGGGNNADEIWIGANTGAYVGNVQLVGHQIFFNAPGGGVYLSGTFYNSSDARLKTDVTPIPRALERVASLQGVNFRWKNGDGKPGMGLLAQDVEKSFPELVSSDPHNGMKSVAYVELIGALVESVKDLKTRNEELQRKVQSLEKTVAGLK